MKILGVFVSLVLLVATVAMAQPADKPVAAQKTGEVHGELVRCEGSLGMTGVHIYFPGTSLQARPRSDGSFEIYYVPPGTYNLIFEFPSGTPATFPGVVSADNTITDIGIIPICRNEDGDIDLEDVDCNDNNPDINSGALEECDGIDNNCNGEVDEGVAGCSECTDADNDGFYAQFGCLTIPDCDDAEPTTNPLAEEICDDYDNDCDGFTNEDFDFLSDPYNCGDCDIVCSYPGAEGFCISGTCEIGACLQHYADCNADPGDGCETDVRTSYNCGACGNVCPSRPHSVPICHSGDCLLVCESDWEDCDQNPATGCEIDLNTNPDHCGGCGNSCSVGYECVAGNCELDVPF